MKYKKLSKVLVTALLSATLVGSMTACGSKSDDVSSTTEAASSSSEEEDRLAKQEASVQRDAVETLEEEQAEAEKEAEEEAKKEQEAQEQSASSKYQNGQQISLDSSWEFAEFSEIHTGCAVMYTATANRKNIIVGVNAGHGTSGGSSVQTYCHPDKTAKTTGGSTAAGSIKAVAVSGGMSFYDGTDEPSVTLREAQILRDKLLAEGYDVLMVRDGADVQLDNVARTVICNNVANCHIALHWDGDGLDYDKGCFYCSVPDGIKNMYPTSTIWQQDDALGDSLIEGLSSAGAKINGSGNMDIDLTQTSYSSIPSVDIELGNAASSHDDATLEKIADGLVDGINIFFQ